MIIDAFMFFNEFDILEGRLEYLYDYVDYFVLVESNMSHSGEKKSLNYLKNSKRYKKYQDKIIYFPFITNRQQYNFNRTPIHGYDFQAGSWIAENSQRNHITSVLDTFNDNDVIIISDVDEIPHRSCIDIAKNYLDDKSSAVAIQQILYCYNFSQRHLQPWVGSVFALNSYAKKFGTQHLRNIKHDIPYISNGGWHLTFWGTIENIQNKIKSFAHQELNTDRYIKSEYIKQKISQGQSLFDNEAVFVPEDKTNIDSIIVNIFEKFEKKPLDLI